MSPMTALAIAEGLQEPADEQEWQAAWQCLIDTGMAWALPGRIGRQAANMIENGECRA